MIITCPLCKRAIGPNEALTIGHDAVGSAIVRHVVPKSVAERRGFESDDDFHRRIASAAWEGIEHVRAICGAARFREVTIDGQQVAA